MAGAEYYQSRTVTPIPSIYVQMIRVNYWCTKCILMWRIIQVWLCMAAPSWLAPPPPPPGGSREEVNQYESKSATSPGPGKHHTQPSDQGSVFLWDSQPEYKVEGNIFVQNWQLSSYAIRQKRVIIIMTSETCPSSPRELCTVLPGQGVASTVLYCTIHCTVLWTYSHSCDLCWTHTTYSRRWHSTHVILLGVSAHNSLPIPSWTLSMFV